MDIIEPQAAPLFQHSIEVLINVANSDDSMKVIYLFNKLTIKLRLKGSVLESS